jgi:phosphoribosyl-ATP pyrophosphohydrolase
MTAQWINAKERPKGKPMSQFTLSDLEKRIAERVHTTAAESYTRSLIDKGVAHCAKKMGEEAFEAALAAVQEDQGRFTAEAADLVYHLMVLMNARGVALADVEAELARRTAQSGHAEKAARPKS